MCASLFACVNHSFFLSLCVCVRVSKTSTRYRGIANVEFVTNSFRQSDSVRRLDQPSAGINHFSTSQSLPNLLLLYQLLD